MKLKKVTIQNYRGIKEEKTIYFDSFNCIVGQNDAGKSTILKALDCFLNEKKPSPTDLNVNATTNIITIELFLDFENKQLTLNEEILTSLEQEEITNEDNLVVIKKQWTVNENIGNPKNLIKRKIYDNDFDFLTKTETQLIAKCREHNIATNRANGEDFNNVEKRLKLREYASQNHFTFSYDFEDIPTSGTSKIKLFFDSIKKNLPKYQYFKADTSLEESDSIIQKFFKDIALEIINTEIDTDELETTIKTSLGNVLDRISTKINQVVNASESVTPKVDFDWSKLISTTFMTNSLGNSLPLSARGDGFRRITMMSYFEYLAETNRSVNSQHIIFSFEEPETFLHPSAQQNLFEKLLSLTENQYQVILSTHSPTIVGNSKPSQLIHIYKENHHYHIDQNNVDHKNIAINLGIKPDNTFTPLFSTSKLLFLVEGIDDANALHHTANEYKINGRINETFDDLKINIIPIGGCDSVKHWVNLNLFTKLEKPFYIFLDSDKDHEQQTSPNHTKLLNFGLQPKIDFHITNKRLIENYIHHTVLNRFVPNAHLNYSDFDHVKNICKTFSDQIIQAQLGGSKVCDKHYCKQTYNDLLLSWSNGTDDEFLHLYENVISKLSI